MNDQQSASIIPIRVVKSLAPTDCHHALFPNVSDIAADPAALKTGPLSLLPRAAASKVVAAVAPKLPPQVQLVEKSPGVYDVTVVCSCGETIVVRCESLQKTAKAIPASEEVAPAPVSIVPPPK